MLPSVPDMTAPGAGWRLPYARRMNGCIFCGARGRLTKEHLWPNWLRKEMSISDKFTYRLEDEKDGVEVRDKSFPALPFDQQVRAVCTSCNGGWMSSIEGAAKPLIQRLMRAEGGRLDLAEQQTLASWALLKACVFAELNPDNRAVPAAHREYLYQHRRPPSGGVAVRLASYEVRDLVHYAYQGMTVPVEKGGARPDEPTVYFVTITVGALVVHVAGSLVPRLQFADVPGLEELNLQPIWPASHAVTFDQHHLMTHETLVGFTKMLYNVIGMLEGGAPPAR